MSERTRVFVNERLVEVEAGASLLDAVRAFDPALVAALEQGRAHVTDGVGRPMSAALPAVAGAIVRVVLSARQPPPPQGSDP